ncbi:LRRNT 2 domain-containing protein [Citrus sinensis]|nr:LRRNT 2 domain-containing protein [Citrus sinensis]
MSSLGYFFAINIAFVSGQCQSDQQTLLLQLKSSLTFDPSSSVKLMQWRQSTDCCDWSGVDCDEAGHVIGLDLSTESISGGIENAAILFSLHYLRSLNLARTSFNGTQISSKLANISSLTYLNLSDAGFAGQIPVQISRMASNNLNESMAHFLTRFLEIVCYKLWISMEIDHKERSQNPLPNAKCWRF